jgi:spore germination protein YaaH
MIENNNLTLSMETDFNDASNKIDILNDLIEGYTLEIVPFLFDNKTTDVLLGEINQINVTNEMITDITDEEKIEILLMSLNPILFDKINEQNIDNAIANLEKSKNSRNFLIPKIQSPTQSQQKSELLSQNPQTPQTPTINSQLMNSLVNKQQKKSAEEIEIEIEKNRMENEKKKVDNSLAGQMAKQMDARRKFIQPKDDIADDDDDDDWLNGAGFKKNELFLMKFPELKALVSKLCLPNPRHHKKQDLQNTLIKYYSE